MTGRRDIGRLVMVGVRGLSLDDADARSDVAACKRAEVGGIILFADDVATGGPRNIASPTQTKKLIADLRHELGASVLIAIDQEGGRASRLTPERGFRASIGAADFAKLTPDEQRVEADASAAELAALGIDLNFAPCVDLAIEAGSAVIAGSGRSFGPDPDRVAQCARTVIAALRAAGVGSCIKHFPGHGSAAGDSHLGLVDITDAHQRAELDPYRSLLAGDEAARPSMVMVGHLLDRSVDPSLPASLSGAHIDGQLRGELGWSGVVVTDSLDMGAIRSRWRPGQAAVAAIGAGADLALDGANTPGTPRSTPAEAMVDALLAANLDGELSDEQIARSASRIAGLRCNLV